MSAPAWQETCIVAARAQAEAEARQAWKLDADQPLPFDNRWEHVAQVQAMAMRLGRAVGADLEIVEAAAWLHDVRKGEPAHGVAGAQAATEILAATDFPAHKIEAVAHAIRVHVGLYRAPDAPPLAPVEAAVLWDADKLSKIGALAVMHSLSTANVQGKTLAQRWHYVAQFSEEVLARTVQSMNTQPGRRMAARRYRSMLALLSLWAREAHELGIDLQGDFQLEIPSDYDGLSEE
jgi:uncharacterized protein